MTMRDLTLSEIERLEALAESDVAFEMDEDTFRAFYERTARPLWGYLSRLCGSPQLADDLLQESYYRLLRANGQWQSEAHRRAYLYRIATNLVRDSRRRARHQDAAPAGGGPEAAAPGDVAEQSARRTDLQRAMARLRPRDRALLWLAYAQGHAHAEIAETLGVKTSSVKLLLLRARRKLALLLREPGRSVSGVSSRGVR
jgi:RNA polymerase sigma-70 factor (ECF subfamily)